LLIVIHGGAGMKYDNVELTAELAFIKAVYLFSEKKLKEGRLKNRFEKLAKEVDRLLDNKPKLGKYDKYVAEKRVELFSKKVGWIGKQRHIVSIISFCLALIDESDFNYSKHAPKIIQYLNDIYQYFERGKDAKLLCCLSGSIAHEKWKSAIKEVKRYGDK